MFLLLLTVLFPVVCGLCAPALNTLSRRRVRMGLLIAAQTVETGLGVAVACGPTRSTGHYMFLKGLSVGFTADEMARFFVFLVVVSWLLVTVYATVYLKHEGNEMRFFLCMLLTEGAMLAACLSDNLASMYVFYEMVTLCSMPLVLHSMTPEAVAAAKKYLYYSIAGAFAALFGLFVLYTHNGTLAFSTAGMSGAPSALVLAAVFAMALGFGAKAGMLPLHGWLPTAHPVAPAPASALLSGVIAKVGVLAIIRTLYFVVGPAYLTGTWVQTTLLVLALLTVLTGSTMALREPVFKKRLAYSTVSQISYALVGLFLLTERGMEGALWQITFHAAVKIGLFLSAGMVIFLTGKTRVEELSGMSKAMPVLFTSFTVLSLSLIGIPPTGGFFSKWFLATAALDVSALGPVSWLAPVVLLVSALLTAAYLFEVPMRAFFGKAPQGETVSRLKEPVGMTLPLMLLAAFALLGGVFSSAMGGVLSAVAAAAV